MIHEIKNLKQLKKVTGMTVPKIQRKAMERVFEKCPVRLTDYLVKL